MPSHRLKMPRRQARKLFFAFPRRYWIDKNDTYMGLLSLYANAHGEWMAWHPNGRFLARYSSESAADLGRQRQFEPVTSSQSAVALRPSASSLVDRQLLRFRREMRMPGDVSFQGGTVSRPENCGGRQWVESSKSQPVRPDVDRPL